MNPPVTTFGQRLERARKMRALSLRELSAQLDGLVTQAALAKYEKGEMRPRSEVLIALCRALKLPPDYFFKPAAVTLAGVEFRKRVKFPKKQVERVREEALDFFERYLEVENLLGLSRPELPVVDLTRVPLARLPQAAEEAAAAVRKQWDLGSNPLANVHETLEDHGVKVKVVEADKSFDGFSGRADHCPVIVLAKWLDRDLPRKRFTAAHELGHLVMQLPAQLAKKDEESACHRFAGAFLVPAEVLKREFGERRLSISLNELTALKAEWGISYAALMHRLADLEIISPQYHKRFQIRYRGTLQWHKGEPVVWVGSEQAQRFPQLVYRAAAQEVVTRSKAAQLLGKNLDEFEESFKVAA